MRMASGCYRCILDRAKFEADLIFPSEEDKMEAVEELLDYMACHKRGVPALVGTERERIMKRRSKNPDPYFDLKEGSNAVARTLLPVAQEFYDCAANKLEAIFRIAAAANSMEFGVKGHDFDNVTFGQAFSKILAEKLEGDLSLAQGLLRKFDKIYYLTDNSGEVVFDLWAIDRLVEMGKRVTIGPKAEPILNDVTAIELLAMTKREIVPTGDVVGLSLEHLNPKALEILQDKGWLILAKGMGNFETITEFQEMLKGRLIYVLRAKCQPVADALGVPKGTLVVKPF
jgi:uncharacterized protein with ATP-grasp and redox domains